MPNYVRPLSGNYLNMFLLVLHTLHFLVFTRGSRVIDAYNQAVEKNKYCSKVAECLPGTHVMCMYGNTTAMNPRCAEGKVHPLYDTERDLFLEIFNGFRRDLASGKEILGKDGIRLPQARNMRKLFWDSDLETFAQAWANQCQVVRNQCHSTDQYPTAGQIVGISRFSYLDWSIQHRKSDDSGLTSERRKNAILDFTGKAFAAHKAVTPGLIGSGHGNVYLMSVYGSTSHIGCAMSSFVEFQARRNGNYYNTVIVVCNFSSRPQIGEPVYMTNGTGPCSCFEGFKNESCLCVPGKDDINDEDNNLEVDNDGTIETQANQTSNEGKCPSVASILAVLPIVDVHDADLTKQKMIKERLQNAKKQYFCKHDRELRTRFFGGGPVDQNSFLISEFPLNLKNLNVKRKQRDLDLAMPTNLHLQIKPKLDVSSMNRRLLHNHHNAIKDNSRTNKVNQLFSDIRNTGPAKVYVTSINGKPIKYPFEDIQETQRLSPKTLSSGGFSNQEPNVFITSINGRPIKYHYDEQFKKSQKPITKELSYDVKDFNSKESPYMAISNDNLDKLIIDVDAGEQELKGMWHNRYIDEIVQKIMRRTGEDATNMDNISVTKEIGKGDLINRSGSVVFVTDNSDPLTIETKEKIIQINIDNLPTRNQMTHKHESLNKANLKNEEGNQIVKEMRKTAAAKVHVTSVNGKSVKYPLENIKKSQGLSTKTLPYQVESKIYTSSINGNPKKLKNINNPGTRVLSYELEGLNDKGSPYTSPNDNYEQLLDSLLRQEQELKDILYNSYDRERDHKTMQATGDNNILITKQIRDLTDNTSPKVFVANNNGRSNFGNEPETKTIEPEIGKWPIKNQKYNGNNSLTEDANQIFKDTRSTTATKVYVTFVKGDHVEHPLENIENSLRLNTWKFPYDEQDITKQEESKIDKINANSKGNPEKYHLDEKFKNLQKPSTRVLSYDVQGLNYKISPYTTIQNDKLDQLLRYLLKNYIQEMDKKNLRITGKDITNKDNIITNKQIEKDVNGRRSKVSVIDNNNGPSNIANEQNIIKTQNNNWPTRNQVPLHIHAYGINNFDYYRHFHATKEFVKPRATLMNNENENAQHYAIDASNAYSPGKNRLFDYGANKIHNYYMDMLTNMQ